MPKGLGIAVGIALVVLVVAQYAGVFTSVPPGTWHMNGRLVQMVPDARSDHSNGKATVAGQGLTDHCDEQRQQVGLSVDVTKTSLRWYNDPATADCKFSRANLQPDGTIRFDPLRP